MNVAPVTAIATLAGVAKCARSTPVIENAHVTLYVVIGAVNVNDRAAVLQDGKVRVEEGVIDPPPTPQSMERDTPPLPGD